MRGGGQINRHGRILKHTLGQAAVERVVFTREVREKQVEASVGINVGEGHAHAGLGPALPVVAAAAEDCLVDKAAVALVDPEGVGHLVVGHVEIDQAVAGEVGSHQPEAGSPHRGQPGEGSAVFKLQRPLGRLGGRVEKHAVDAALKEVRAAEVGRAAAGAAAGPGHVVDVAGDHNVEPAVAIEVNQRRRGAPARVAVAGLGRQLTKTPRTFVVKQGIVADAGGQQLGQAVVGEVADRDPHPDAGQRQPGGGRLVKPATGVLPEDHQLAAARVVLRRKAHQHQVEAAIAIEVAGAAAAAGDRRQVVAKGFARCRRDAIDEIAADVALRLQLKRGGTIGRGRLGVIFRELCWRAAAGGEHRCDAGNTEAHPGRPTRQRT